MSAVQIERRPDGWFTFTVLFRNEPACQRALSAVLAVNEAAFEPAPAPQPPQVVSHTLAEAILRDNPDAPLIYPVTVDEE